MKSRGSLLSFTKGMLAPEVEARFDLSSYQAGVRNATNCRIRRTGGLSKRVGTRIVCEVLSSPARLIPFQFSDQQAYALLFRQAKMEPLALGGAVLEAGLSVTNITNANPAVVTVQNHGYTVGRQVYFIGIEGMEEINGRFITILSVPNADTITLDIDTTGFGTFAGSGGGQVNTDPPDPPPSPPAVPPEEPEPVAPVVGGVGDGGIGFGGIWSGNTGPNIP